MLKLLPPTNLIQQSNTKCGEIFIHNYLDFTIYCTFCDIKLFAFNDFLLHIQNVHFGNNLLETEDIMKDPGQYLKTVIRNETLKINISKDKEEVANKFIKNSYGNVSFIEDNHYTSSDEEPILVIKKTEKVVFEKQSMKTAIGNNLQDGNYVKLEYNNLKVESYKDDGSNKLNKKSRNPDFFFCSECKEKFLHKKNLDQHVFDFHNGYKCSQCDKRFRLRHHLSRHVRTHTAEKKFSCTIIGCGRNFSDETYLKRHLEVHTMERTFVCDFENCGKAFQTQRRLLTHNYTHRRPKKLVCDACGYTCRANITLKIHQRVHTGEKPFLCTICQKCFISQTALTEHMITHSKTRPYVCKICNATFANQRIMKRHTFIHSDDRNFKCKLCGSSFKQANGLDGHMRRMHKAPKLSAVTFEKSK